MSDTPDSPATAGAAELLKEIVSQAQRADRHCYWEHGNFDEQPEALLSAEQVGSELGYLRDVICRLGWLADIAYTKIRPDLGPLRGGAEEWLLSPGIAAIVKEVSNGKP